MAAHQPTRPSLRQQFPHEYNCWNSMRGRCACPSNASWKYYGARGVAVCTRWRESFAAFLADMGPAPTPKHQIDRGLNCFGYIPGNCFWSTPAKQQENTSKVRHVRFRGVVRPLHIWCRLLGLNRSTVKSRLDELGWSIHRTLSTPTISKFARRRRSAG